MFKKLRTWALVKYYLSRVPEHAPSVPFNDEGFAKKVSAIVNGERWF